jgi:hypothetical protein
MLKLQTSGHVRSRRNIKSFRALRHSMGLSSAPLDRARTALEEEGLATRQAGRKRLAGWWDEHFEGAAGSLRVLPPSARANVATRRGSAKKKKAR